MSIKPSSLKPRVIVLTIDRNDPLAVAIDVAAARAQKSAPRYILNQLSKVLGVPEGADVSAVLSEHEVRGAA